ncbi:spore coat protein [[Clostridium] fimetarium]|uniref:Coat F domain-containing protein n=1 Tax=[Clostridium] fimetarium TaxID=99656 RepID=A0A1I0RVI0_9FIRM|nr:spore coat protein [[Clostridium] fimetarium]SEW45424.1 Coat F domain-containing protein [[Clostridium] fimetarium]
MEQQIYTDKEVLGDALATEKASTNLYNTFANECVHPEVRSTMLHMLEEEHSIQDDVFKLMHEKGFYPTPEADDNKVNQTIQKFSCGVNLK